MRILYVTFLIVLISQQAFSDDCLQIKSVFDSVNTYIEGCSKIKSSHIKNNNCTTVSWRQLRDALFTGVKNNCRQVSRISQFCKKDTFWLTSFDNNVILENGPFESFYYLIYGEFPTLLHGIKSGMNRKTVRDSLGLPIREFNRQCSKTSTWSKWHYSTNQAGDVCSLEFYFINDSLKALTCNNYYLGLEQTHCPED